MKKPAFKTLLRAYISQLRDDAASVEDTAKLCCCDVADEKRAVADELEHMVDERRLPGRRPRK